MVELLQKVYYTRNRNARKRERKRYLNYNVQGLSKISDTSHATSQIQETQRTPNRTNKKNSTFSYVILKFRKQKTKRKCYKKPEGIKITSSIEEQE